MQISNFGVCSKKVCGNPEDLDIHSAQGPLVRLVGASNTTEKSCTVFNRMGFGYSLHLDPSVAQGAPELRGVAAECD
jgi:hypothetical protein